MSIVVYVTLDLMKCYRC